MRSIAIFQEKAKFSWCVKHRKSHRPNISTDQAQFYIIEKSIWGSIIGSEADVFFLSIKTHSFKVVLQNLSSKTQILPTSYVTLSVCTEPLRIVVKFNSTTLVENAMHTYDTKSSRGFS